MAAEEKNISFFDAIAGEYNLLDNAEASNKAVREKVRQRFKERVHGNRVLDFGGGTGLDLEWLSKNYLQVCFCEPSEKMREQAIRLNAEKIKNPSIVFTNNEQSDFHKWTANSFPHRMNGVLANFAVLNNIADMDALFRAFADVMEPGGIIIANILHPRLFKLYKKHFLKMLVSRLLQRTFTIKLTLHAAKQRIYLHTLSSLRKSAAPYFELEAVEDLNGFGFLLVQFRRNN